VIPCVRSDFAISLFIYFCTRKLAVYESKNLENILIFISDMQQSWILPGFEKKWILRKYIYEGTLHG